MNNNINLNLYKSFYDVARFGSFSKAAEFTYTTQPAISKAIKKLEEDLGVKLFHRKSNGVELTEKGKELLYYVEKSYGSILTGTRLITENDNLDRGKLCIGMPTNSGNLYVYDKVTDFHKRYPNIDIYIFTGTTSYLMSLLDTHMIDLIIDTAPVTSSNKDFVSGVLYEVDYCFAYKDKKYDKVKSIKDLVEEKLILPLPETKNRNDLDEVFIKNNVMPKNVLNIHTSEMIIDFIKMDAGIGYVMYDLVKKDVENGELKVVKIKKLPKAQIMLAYNKKYLSKIPSHFIELYMNNNDITK